jgi:protein CpxP
MKSRHALPILCAVILVLGLTAASSAQGPGEPPEMGRRMIEGMAKRLGLNESEAGQLGDIMRKHHETMAPAMDELHEARQTLRDQIATETFNESAIREQAARVARLEADLAVARGLHHQEMRDLLSPEQYERFQTMQRRREHGRTGGGPMGPGNHHGGHRHKR